MAWDYDKIKAQLYFTHLLRASKKFEERHLAKEQIARSLQKLSKVKVNKSFQNEIELLKSKIDELVEKQASIVSDQSKRVSANSELKSKINLLETKLSDYIEEKKKKNKRIKELEDKIKAKQQREEIIGSVKGELEGMELIYEHLKESGELDPAKLKKIEARISLMKMKLNKIKNK